MRQKRILVNRIGNVCEFHFYLQQKSSYQKQILGKILSNKLFYLDIKDSDAMDN